MRFRKNTGIGKMAIQFIDTHCHLDAAEFGNTQEALVQDALATGVSTIVIPSVA